MSKTVKVRRLSHKGSECVVVGEKEARQIYENRGPTLALDQSGRRIESWRSDVQELLLVNPIAGGGPVYPLLTMVGKAFRENKIHPEEVFQSYNATFRRPTTIINPLQEGLARSLAFRR